MTIWTAHLVATISEEKRPKMNLKVQIKREKVKQQEKRKRNEKNYKNIEIEQKSFCSGKDA